jgi:ribosomal protein L22
MHAAALDPALAPPAPRAIIGPSDRPSAAKRNPFYIPRMSPFAAQNTLGQITKKVTAKFANVEMSVKKLNVVAKLVRRLHVNDAIIQLSLINTKQAARAILKVRREVVHSNQYSSFVGHTSGCHLQQALRFAPPHAHCGRGSWKLYSFGRRQTPQYAVVQTVAQSAGDLGRSGRRPAKELLPRQSRPR